MAKRVLLISHIDEEAPLGNVLRRFLDGADAQREVFLISASSTSLQGGEPRRALFDQKLRNADVVLIVCSERSVQRPWLCFEAGAAWQRDGVTVLAICHSGMQAPPEPFGLFGHLVIEQTDFVERLLLAIAQATGQPPAKLDQPAFRRALSAAIAEPGTTGEPPGLPTGPPATNQIARELLVLLQHLALAPTKLMPLAWLANLTHQPEAQALVHLRELCARGLANEIRRKSGVPRFRISAAGVALSRQLDQLP